MATKKRGEVIIMERKIISFKYVRMRGQLSMAIKEVDYIYICKKNYCYIYI